MNSTITERQRDVLRWLDKPGKFNFPKYIQADYEELQFLGLIEQTSTFWRITERGEQIARNGTDQQQTKTL